MKVLLTDYAWADLEIETRTLADIGTELIVAPAKDPASLAAAAKGVDAIMTNWAKVTDQVIEEVPKLRIIARLGIGLDNIDVACRHSGKIAVTNVPDYCLIEVAEHALALLLALARKTAFYHLQTKRGEYDLAAGPRLARIEGRRWASSAWATSVAGWRPRPRPGSERDCHQPHCPDCRAGRANRHA